MEIRQSNSKTVPSSQNREKRWGGGGETVHWVVSTLRIQLSFRLVSENRARGGARNFQGKGDGRRIGPFYESTRRR